MKATKNIRELKKSAKTTASRYFTDLRSDMLFGDELMEFIQASVMWEKDEGFHVPKYYELVYIYITELHDKFYITCCECYNFFMKKDIRKKDDTTICIQCYRKKYGEIKKLPKRKTPYERFEEAFSGRYRIMYKKNLMSIEKGEYVSIRCECCKQIFIKKIDSIFRNGKHHNPKFELCNCKNKRANIILRSSEEGKALLIEQKKIHEKLKKQKERSEIKKEKKRQKQERYKRIRQK